MAKIVLLSAYTYLISVRRESLVDRAGLFRPRRHIPTTRPWPHDDTYAIYDRITI